METAEEYQTQDSGAVGEAAVAMIGPGRLYIGEVLTHCRRSVVLILIINLAQPRIMGEESQ